MKVKEMIRQNENDMVLVELAKNGYKNIDVRHCKLSMFYVKDIGENKTQYIRKDFEQKGKYDIYVFETWVRDNSKDVFEEGYDSNNKKINSMFKFDELMNIIKGI